MTEECPHCGVADSTTVPMAPDIQKCNHCFGTWVSGSGQPARDPAALDAARDSVLLAAVLAVKNGGIDPDSHLALAVRQYHKTLSDFHDPQPELQSAYGQKEDRS